MSDKLFYMQVKGYVGNDLLWWKEGGAGYTTDVSKAGVWTESRALRQAKMRDEDIPWPKEYIDEHTRPVVDCQTVDLDIAMRGEN